MVLSLISIDMVPATRDVSMEISHVSKTKTAVAIKGKALGINVITLTPISEHLPAQIVQHAEQT